jgi:hypothetical protein
MAHFAQLNARSIVQRVIVVDNINTTDLDGNESEAIGIAYCQALYGNETIWRQTSYNATFRCNYAGAGFYYDTDLDAFIAPQPFPKLDTKCQLSMASTSADASRQQALCMERRLTAMGRPIIVTRPLQP